MTDRKTLTTWTADLRRAFPARYPVRVYLVPVALLRKDHVEPVNGDCAFMRRTASIRIRLANNLSVSETATELLHEWAHAIRWHLPDLPGDSDHDEVFSVLHGRIRQYWFPDAEAA